MSTPPADPTPAEALAEFLLAARLLCELRPLGGVTCRRLGMLRALFHDSAATDAPFGLLRGTDAFFKAGPGAVTKYIARGMWPYRHPVGLAPLRGYWRVPPEVLDDGDDLRRWAGWAIDAARQFGCRPRRRAPVLHINTRRRRRRSAPPARNGDGGPDT